MTEIVFSSIAQKRLVDIALFIFEQTHNPDLADGYLDQMKHYIIETLTHFPRAGRPCDELGHHTRKLVYQGYSVIYEIQEERIEILTLYRENLS